MQHTITYDPQSSMLVVTTTGVPNLESYCAMSDDIAKAHREHGFLRLLIDGTGVDPDFRAISEKEVIAYADYQQHLRDMLLRIYIASVVAAPVHYGLTRMFTTVVELSDIPMQLRIFTSRQEAEKWLLSCQPPPEWDHVNDTTPRPS
jgi:hypothetical protein